MTRVARVLLWLMVLLVALAGVAAGGFVLYARLQTREPLPDALAAMQSTEAVEVSNDRWVVFTPRNVSAVTGLVLYPGGFVDPRAYAPAARDIAGHGYLVVVVPMPLGLAFLGANQITEVISAFPEMESWAIGGHSLGGTMASWYACQNPGKVSGLVLWASHPAGDCDLSGSNMPATSIYGTLDGLVSSDDIERSRALLPEDTRFVAIEGGNHAQFGWYGNQKGDLTAIISPEDQQKQTVAGTVSMLELLPR